MMGRQAGRQVGGHDGEAGRQAGRWLGHDGEAERASDSVTRSRVPGSQPPRHPTYPPTHRLRCLEGVCIAPLGQGGPRRHHLCLQLNLGNHQGCR
jgi:hypothetical protein